MKVRIDHTTRTATIVKTDPVFQHSHNIDTVEIMLDYYDNTKVYKLNFKDASGVKNLSRYLTYAGHLEDLHYFRIKLNNTNTAFYGNLEMSLAIFTLETVIIGGLPVVKLVNIWNSETFVQYIEESQEDTTVDIDSEETLIIDEIWAALNTKLNYTHKGYYTFNDLQIADQAITTAAFIVHIQQRCAFHSILDGSTIYGQVSLVTDRPENSTLAFIYENGVLYARTANGRYFYDTVWLKYATNQDIVSLQAEIDSDISTHNSSETAHDDIRTSVIPLTYIDTDVALTANSDVKIASQKATKTYNDTKVSTHNSSETAHGKGSANGIAELDANGHVPSSQLPSYVDDVLEYANFAALPVTGEAAKIYITLDDNKTYRWGGTVYVFMSDDVTLGETNATAYRGDRGKTAYDHSQVIDGTNPHNTTFANIASKPTTLAGIGITDAFTKAETTALLEVLKTTYGLTEQLIATLADTNTLAMANVSAYDFLLLELQNISGAHEVFGSVVIKPETFTAAGDLVQIETKEGAAILSYATLTYDGSTNFTFSSSNAADTLVVTGYKKDEVVAIGVITTHTGNTLVNAGLTVKADIDELDSKIVADKVLITSNIADIIVAQRDIRENEMRIDTVEEVLSKQGESTEVGTVADVEIISLPKDVANGALKVLVEGVTLQASQLVTNPDFTTDITGWTATNIGTPVVSSGIVSFTATAQNGKLNQVISIVSGSKYYIVSKIKSSSSSVLIGVAELSPASVSHSGSNAYELISFIGLSSSTANVNLRVLDTRASNWTQIDVDYIYRFNISTLISNKQYSPISNTTFDLMTDAQIKTQMDAWVASGELPNDSIQSVGGNKRVKAVGKNLATPFEFNGTFEVANGVNVTATDRYIRTNKISIKPNTAYMLSFPSTAVASFYSYYLYNNNVYIAGKAGAAIVSSVTLSAVTIGNANQIVIAIGNASGGVLPSKSSQVQLETGSTASTYESFKSTEMYLQPNVQLGSVGAVKDSEYTRNGKYYRMKRVSDLTAVTGVVAVNTTNYPTAKTGGVFINYLTAGGSETGIIGTNSTSGNGTLQYEILTPVETEIQASGNLLGNSRGTVYVDDVIADIDIYDTNINITNTSYTIKALRSIIKLNSDGTQTELAVSGATVAGDKLSFTHTSLTAGDIVFFTYDYTNTNNVAGRTTITYYDDRFVVPGTGTAAGKVYKMTPTAVDGVFGMTLTEI